MNVFDLQNLGVEEMNEMEVREVDGGWSWSGFMVAGLPGGFYKEISEFCHGFADGFMSL